MPRPLSVGSAAITLTSDATDLVKGLNNSNRALKRNQESVRRAQRVYRNFANRIRSTVKSLVSARTAVVGITAAFGAVLATRGIREYAVALDAIAQSTGLSVGGIQNFHNALRNLNIDAEAGNDILREITKRIREAEIAGTGTAFEAFEMLGINLRDANNQFRSAFDILDDLSKLPLERGSLVFYLDEIASGRGEELAPLIQQAQRLNVTFSELIAVQNQSQNLRDDEIQGILEFNKAMESLSVTVRNVLGRALAGSITQLRGFLMRIGEITQQLVAALPSALNALEKGIGFIVDNFDRLAIGLAAIVATRAVAFFIGLGKAVAGTAASMGVAAGATVALKAAIRGLFITTGVGAFIVALVTIIEHFTEIEGLVDRIVSKPVTNTLQQQFSSVAEEAQALGSRIRQIQVDIDNLLATRAEPGGNTPESRAELTNLQRQLEGFQTRYDAIIANLTRTAGGFASRTREELRDLLTESQQALVTARRYLDENRGGGRRGAQTRQRVAEAIRFIEEKIVQLKAAQQLREAQILRIVIRQKEETAEIAQLIQGAVEHTQGLEIPRFQTALEPLASAVRDYTDVFDRFDSAVRHTAEIEIPRFTASIKDAGVSLDEIQGELNSFNVSGLEGVLSSSANALGEYADSFARFDAAVAHTANIEIPRFQAAIRDTSDPLEELGIQLAEAQAQMSTFFEFEGVANLENTIDQVTRSLDATIDASTRLIENFESPLDEANQRMVSLEAATRAIENAVYPLDDAFATWLNNASEGLVRVNGQVKSLTDLMDEADAQLQSVLSGPGDFAGVGDLANLERNVTRDVERELEKRKRIRERIAREDAESLRKIIAADNAEREKLLMEHTEREKKLLEDRQRNIQDIADQFGDAFGNFAKGLATDFDNARDLAHRFVVDLRDILINQVIFEPVKRFFSQLIGGLLGGGGGGGLFGGLLGFQSGGRPPVGTPVVVGEGGRSEIFVPDSAGRVYPLNQLPSGGGGTVINLTVNNSDREGVIRGVTEIAPILVEATKAGTLEDLSRNTPIRTTVRTI